MEILGRYQILGELGRGGCGIVYRALDPGIGRTVAIKTILADAASSAGASLLERFRREARSAGSLSHPHIVTIHEFNDSGDGMFIVMEFVDGPTLSDKMGTGERLPLDFVLAVLRSAASALDYAHSNNIVHRDVKPANFMINPAGQLKMTDFGIAKMLGSEISLTNTGMIIGTAQYMSPEQIAAKPATGRSDQFSLAVIAYEMLTGQKPFQGDSWASVMHEIMSADPPPVAQHRQDLGDQVSTALRRALAKDPAARYPTCTQFADELTEAVMGVTLQRTLPKHMTDALKRPLPRPTGEVLPDTKLIHRGPPPANPYSKLLPIAAGVILLAGAAIWFSTRKPAEKPPETAAATPAAAAGASTATAPAAENLGADVRAKQPSAKRAETPSKSTPTPAAPIQVPTTASTAAPRVVVQPSVVAANTTPAPAPVQAAPVVPPPVVREEKPVEKAPEKPPAPAPAPAPVVVAPPPVPVVIAPTPAPAPVARAAESDDQRKAADNAAARRAIDDALNRYRAAFDNKDADALKGVWPSLGKSEFSSIQNFFKIARSVNMQIRTEGDPEINATGASVRAHRIMAATDERGALPQQDQTVRITLRRVANAMVIESVVPVNR